MIPLVDFLLYVLLGAVSVIAAIRAGYDIARVARDVRMARNVRRMHRNLADAHTF